MAAVGIHIEALSVSVVEFQALATECDMAALIAEILTLTTTVGIMADKLAKYPDPKIVQYDEMLASFATLSGSCKETVQTYIVAADEKQ